MNRIIKNLITGQRDLKSYFSDEILARLEARIEQSEATHRGELKILVEAALPVSALLSKVTTRARALEHFSLLKLWDTEERTGVLLYVLISERQFEIIADRGITRAVTEARWLEIAHVVEEQFRQGKFEEGMVLAIDLISASLTEFFPAGGSNPNEISNRVLVC